MHSSQFPLCSFVAVLLSTFPIIASPPSSNEDRAKIIGKPVHLSALPASIQLMGQHSSQQLLITGHYADGSQLDLTLFSSWQVAQPDVVTITDGFIRGKKNGSTTLTAIVGGLKLNIPVTVGRMDDIDRVSFRHHVIGSLNVGGCNAGACHGTPSGKNGFRLSLRGYDPALDYLQLSRDVLGRRSDRLNPYASLFLLKGMGRVPHEGGARLGADSVAVEMIASWLADGMQDDPKSLASLTKIEVMPGSRVLNAPARWQQLSVLAHFADGTTKDMTRLTVFSSSDSAIADVSPNGLVEFKQAGEVAILCRYLEQMQAVRLTYLEPKPGFVWKNPPEANYIDHLVNAKLKQMSLTPSNLCTDDEFIRRCSLDLCGTLPTPEEVRRFLDNKSPTKRAELIDSLLQRPEYADFWALKWADVLRSSRKTIQLKGAHAFQVWLREHLAANTGFDQLIRELITANGSTYANPPANYYRIAKDPQNQAAVL